MALLFQGDCLPPKHLHSNDFRLFLTKDRVLEIKCLQSHECKSHQQRILRKLHWIAQMVQESRSVCEWSIMKLVELKPPRLSITHWTLLSHLPVYLSWHLCLPVNLTLSPFHWALRHSCGVTGQHPYIFNFSEFYLWTVVVSHSSIKGRSHHLLGQEYLWSWTMPAALSLSAALLNSATCKWRLYFFLSRI